MGQSWRTEPGALVEVALGQQQACDTGPRVLLLPA